MTTTTRRPRASTSCVSTRRPASKPSSAATRISPWSPRHFTPKHAAWLNQIECWFSILGRHLLERGSFTSTDELAAKIDAYVAWYLQTDRPFRWSYRPKSWD